MVNSRMSGPFPEAIRASQEVDLGVPAAPQAPLSPAGPSASLGGEGIRAHNKTSKHSKPKSKKSLKATAKVKHTNNDQQHLSSPSW